MGHNEKTRECSIIKIVHPLVLLGVNNIGNLKYSKADYSVFLRSRLILNKQNIQFVSRMSP